MLTSNRRAVIVVSARKASTTPKTPSARQQRASHKATFTNHRTIRRNRRKPVLMPMPLPCSQIPSPRIVAIPGQQSQSHPSAALAIHRALRCGAYARTTGKPCRSPAMKNGRCRMHGGKAGRKPTHGHYTKAAIADRRRSRSITRLIREWF